MAFELPPLPYKRNALEPHISKETLDYHYGKHHQGYVKKLNAQVADTDMEDRPLEEIVKTAQGKLFNNAAQVWNHSFYWQCLSPQGGGSPSGALLEAINNSFGSLEKFKEAFTKSAAGNFGSGWTWLVKTSNGALAILNTENAKTPLTDAAVLPLLTVDVWEHAYYIDYRNSRPKYLDAFWALINWDFVSDNFS
jgi:Fe-Mn family superoxide dismutase